MFAWILNTKPLNVSSSGLTRRLTASRGPGGGACATKRSSNSCTPKLLIAEPKNTGVCLPARYSRRIETLGRAVHQLEAVAQLAGLLGQQLVELRVVEALHHVAGLDAAAVRGAEEVHAVFEQVVHAAKALAAADRPGHRRAADVEHALDLVEQFQRFAPLAVELVDEGHDRRVAQPAHLHQLDGAIFNALGAVDHHQRRVHGGQRAIGVLGEVLVARRVEQVDDAVLVRELHDRRGHGDAALFLDLHPVGGCVARGLAPLDRAGELDRAAVQQQLFGERGLAGVGVRDDGESAAAADFAA